MSDDGRLQDLIELGRAKGRLSTEDLQRVMPVAAMSLEDLADVILRLERAGVDVDVDPALLQRDPGAAPRRPVLVQPVPDSMLGTETGRPAPQLRPPRRGRHRPTQRLVSRAGAASTPRRRSWSP